MGAGIRGVKVKIDQDKLEHELDAKLRPLLRAAAEAGAEMARAHAPVDTGHLRDSIQVEDTDEGVQYGSDVEYAADQEWGTYKMPAQPFLRPSMDAAAAVLRHGKR